MVNLHNRFVRACRLQASRRVENTACNRLAFVRVAARTDVTGEPLSALVRKRSSLGTRDAPVKTIAEGRGRYPCAEFEYLREVALVGKAGIQGDLYERQLGRGKTVAGKFNAEFSDKFTYRAAVEASE
jgi:hypothetical protein